MHLLKGITITRARKKLVAVEDMPFYHCISRCVRRAYLCGEDYQSGQNFDHRKLWLVERIKFLSSVFAIDVCAYAVMSNHYHVVLFINQDEASSLDHEQILERWLRKSKESLWVSGVPASSRCR